MSYTPTEWKNGDVITAEKLNKIESGIEDNIIKIVSVVYEASGTGSIISTDATYNEINEAYNNNKIIFIKAMEQYYNNITAIEFIPLTVNVIEPSVNNWFYANVRNQQFMIGVSIEGWSIQKNE